MLPLLLSLSLSLSVPFPLHSLSRITKLLSFISSQCMAGHAKKKSKQKKTISGNARKTFFASPSLAHRMFLSAHTSLCGTAVACARIFATHHTHPHHHCHQQTNCPLPFSLSLSLSLSLPSRRLVMTLSPPSFLHRPVSSLQGCTRCFSFPHTSKEPVYLC